MQHTDNEDTEKYSLTLKCCKGLNSLQTADVCYLWFETKLLYFRLLHRYLLDLLLHQESSNYHRIILKRSGTQTNNTRG